MKNLPIGTQSFEILRSQDLLYVDRTEFIHRLVTTAENPCSWHADSIISKLTA
ncbi:MAG: AAA family ATPase [Bacteroidales bacterium]|jgi:hypothetical protein|nr:AAA family ATPase [Bacteroidales bacterium]